MACLGIGASSVRAEPSLTDVTVTRWGLADGLPQTSVTSLVQSRDGYLWLTTFGGIARFDGLTFTVHNLASTPQLGTNRYLTSYEDRRGWLWFGGENGALVRYRAGQFERVAMPPGVDDSVIAVVDDPGGRVYATTHTKLLVVVDDDVVATAVPVDSQRVDGTGLAADGALWGVNALGPRCLLGPCPDDRSAHGDTVDRVIGNVVGHADDGSLWLVGYQGLWRLAPGSQAPTLEHPIVPVGFHSALRGLAIDSVRQRVWVSAGRQLWRRDGPDSGWREVAGVDAALLAHAKDGLRSLLVDREGGLWVGMDRGGLVRVRDPDVDRFTAAAGLGDAAFTVVEDRAGRTWVSGNCMPLRVRRPGASFELARGIDAPCPLAMAVADDGAVWIADRGRLLRITAGADASADSVAIVDLGPDLATAFGYALIFDETHTLWVGTDAHGLVRLDRGADGSYRVGRRWRAADGLGSDRVRVITPVASSAGGGLWLGTDAGAARLTADGTITSFDQRAGLAAGTIRDIQLGADGSIWFASYGGGLSRRRDDRFVTFTSRQGLCDDTVSRVIEVDGELWVNGNRGVSHVAITDLDEVARGARAELRCLLLQTGEGNGGVQPSGWRGVDGRLWFPTIDGVVRIDPTTTVGKVTPPPLVAIEAVINQGKPLRTDDAAVVRIAAGRGDLDVRYTGLAYDAPAQLRFRHRLLGRDVAWIDAGSRRSVNYTRLPPGPYTFEVTVQNQRGQWAEPARLRFAIAPHLWQTTWFPFAAGGLGLLLAVGVFQLRVRAVRHRNRLLQAEVLERQSAEASAREQEERYRTLFESTTDGLFVHDPSGRLVEVNGAACALLDLPRAALLARGLAASLAADHRAEFAAMVTACTAERKTSTRELILLRGDGNRRELRISTAPVDIGGVTHAFCAAVDLTDAHRAEAQRREYEQRRQQGQKLEALGLLAGGIAHDFNNHLAAIGTSAASLRAGATSPRLASSAADIQQSVERAGALVHQLLVFGRRQPGDARPIDPSAAVAELMPLLVRLLPDGIALDHRARGPSCTIHITPVEFEQSVMNLVVNARDAMPRGGQITITTTAREIGAEEAASHRVEPGRYAVIEVADTGLGIDAETRARMFDPFFTTKELGRGTGLGLTILHTAIEKARGFITVESTVGVGTTFCLHVPAAAPPLDRPTSAAPRATPAVTTTGFRILLCDDAELVRRGVGRLLELNGHQVVETATPELALAAFERDPDGFDLVLTDVVLPTWSGPELAGKLRALRPALPVVLMSGHTFDVEIAQLDQRTRFLKKPFAVEELDQVIALALER